MQLQDILTILEQQSQKVTQALLTTDPQALEQHSAFVRDATVALAQAVDQARARGPIPPALLPRLQALRATLTMQRENLARVAVITDRQVAGLLPPGATGAAATYGDSMGRAPAGAAGVARLYKSAG